jgi:uridine phosphorylase
MKKRIQPHIMCGLGDVAKSVLIPGDPKRAEKIATFFDYHKKVADYRGYVTFTGQTGTTPISTCSSGIGCPSAAIVVEELTNIGAENLIRVGTTGALQSDLHIGDIVIATAAVRADGTTNAYVPPGYPAVANFQIVKALIEAANQMNIQFHLGIVVSSDAFYAENKDFVKSYSEANILSVEMEASVIFTLTNLKRLRGGAILVVDSNLLTGIKKSEFNSGEKTGELDPRVQEAINDEIKIAIEAVKIMECNSQKLI